MLPGYFDTLRTPEPEWVEVIGVVAHQRQTSLAEPGRKQIYFTDGFANHGFANRWAVRTAGHPAQFAGEIRAEIAATLAGVGLYGVLSTVVRQRTSEIGVRMAFGAAPASIFQLVVGQGLRLSAAGIGSRPNGIIAGGMRPFLIKRHGLAHVRLGA